MSADDSGNAIEANDRAARQLVEEALRASEERYRSFIRQSSEGIWRFELEEPIPITWPEDEQIDAFYRLAYLAECNDALARMYGFATADEITGARLGDMLVRSDPRNTAYLRAFIRAGYRLNDAESFEVDREGQPRYIINNLVGILEDGLLLRAWGTQRDITERRLTEEAARDARERLQLAIAAGQMGTWTRDLDAGNRVDWTPELEALFGLAPGEFPGTEAAFFAFIHPEDRAPLAQAVATAIAERTDYTIEFRFYPKGGGQRWMIGRGRATYDEQGVPVRLAGIGIDITARKQAEEALQFLADASTELATLVDYETTLQKVARLAVPFFADLCMVDLVTEGGGLERVAFAHADPAKESILAHLTEHYSYGGAEPSPVQHVVRGGRPILIPEVTDAALVATARDAEHLRLVRALELRSLLCVPLISRGRVLGTIMLSASESRRRYTETDLAVAEDLARRAATALENARLYREAREAERRKDEFLAMLAHELRNPLAPISNALHLLELRGDDPVTRERAGAVLQRQFTQLVRLVDDLLDVSRITRGKVKLRPERLDLGAVITGAVESSRPFIAARSHEVTVALPPEPLSLEADPARLEQILTNLLNNAAKYMEEGGRIWLTASREGDEAVVSVRDAGVGIAAETLPHIFDLFAQAERSLDRADGGLGIGLTLVRTLVRMHGGSVTAHSPGLGQGSEFVVRLPLAPDTG